MINLNELRQAAIDCGYSSVVAESFDVAHKVGLSVKKNGISHAVSFPMDSSADDFLVYFDTWFSSKEKSND